MREGQETSDQREEDGDAYQDGPEDVALAGELAEAGKR